MYLCIANTHSRYKDDGAIAYIDHYQPSQEGGQIPVSYGNESYITLQFFSNSLYNRQYTFPAERKKKDNIPEMTVKETMKIDYITLSPFQQLKSQ